MRKIYLVYFILILFTQKVNAQIVSNYAGTGVAGSTGENGLAIDAEINNPYGIATDSQGNVYFADQGNFSIRKIDYISKIISTVVNTDENGNSMIVNDLTIHNDIIYFLGSVSGSLKLMSLSLIDFNLTNLKTLSNYYIGICAKNDSIFLSSHDNHTIHLFKISTGDFSVISGISGSSGATDSTLMNSMFNGPTGMAIDQNGNIVITEFTTGNIRLLNFTNGTVSTLATGLSWPEGVTVGLDGTIYIAEKGANKIKIITAQGALMNFTGTGNPGSNNGPVNVAEFNSPVKITIDSNDNLYISDYENHLVRNITCETATSPSILISTNSEEFCIENQIEFYLYLDSDISDLKSNEDWVWYKGNCGEDELYVGDTLFINPFQTTVYSVRGENGCYQFGECQGITLNAIACDSLFEPNNSINTAFSPNNDGVNDIWIIELIDQYFENKVYIYNRWGDLVYFTDNYDNKEQVWNGDSYNTNQKVSPGTYFYLIESNETKVANGWVQVIR
jgi:gliding motility-associated-like protein